MQKVLPLPSPEPNSQLVCRGFCVMGPSPSLGKGKILRAWEEQVLPSAFLVTAPTDNIAPASSFCPRQLGPSFPHFCWGLLEEQGKVVLGCYPHLGRARGHMCHRDAPVRSVELHQKSPVPSVLSPCPWCDGDEGAVAAGLWASSREGSTGVLGRGNI